MKKCPRGTKVQSVMFERGRWTKTRARAWLAKHDFATPAVDETESFLRYRQEPPFRFTKGSFRTIWLDQKQGIKAVVACPRSASAKPSKRGAPRSSAPKKRAAKKATPARKSKRRGNPNSQPFRWPRSVVQHGRAIELVVDIGGDQEARYRWPKTGKNAMWLLTDNPGRRIMIVPYNKKRCPHSEFLERFREAGATAQRSAEQWFRATGKDIPIGSIIKVPERTLYRLGTAELIAYYFDLKHRDGAPREHKFEGRVQVRVDDENKPTLIVLSGGGLEITRAGIEG